MTAHRSDAPETPETPLSAGHLPERAEWRLPNHPRSAGRARALLRDGLSAWKVPDATAETAVLLLSELVANACRHARTPPGREIALRCVLGDRGLRVEVCDAGDGIPRPRGTSPEDESGRGLALVAALSDAWGAYPRPCGIGKTVWFELCPSDSNGHH
ncbi:ATP-binding protein [Streptomyces chitinivorans]|uniref:ATP-binding protein n=1 Tax=Streptomyces chitinivorans TaxID=1257027 RepID=A0ABW7HVL3_9ACTN|nr:ATP-binding protein [Streptomyces chitinivorans]MDH2410541.1 ATP-binding protein [Streptomyces chitinivorans]